MLLVIHAGLHKSASTFLQHVLCLNRDLLTSRDVYFEPDKLMQGSHGTAWMTLRDNFRHIEAHLWQARRLGRDKAILSSEDFETLIFDFRRAQEVERAARSAGVTEIEWHFCLRDPGDYFASQYAELSKSSFTDYLTLLMGALRDGRMHVAREARQLPVYWDFCFDYETYLTTFAGAISGKVVLHDFRDKTPFPGHGVIDRLIGPEPSLKLPGPDAHNVRLSSAEVEANFAAMLGTIAEGAGLPAEVTKTLETYLGVPTDVQEAGRLAVSRKYAPGMERLLANGIAAPSRQVPVAANLDPRQPQAAPNGVPVRLGA